MPNTAASMASATDVPGGAGSPASSPESSASQSTANTARAIGEARPDEHQKRKYGATMAPSVTATCRTAMLACSHFFCVVGASSSS